jgi:hypothetical protein
MNAQGRVSADGQGIMPDKTTAGKIVPPAMQARPSDIDSVVK